MARPDANNSSGGGGDVRVVVDDDRSGHRRRRHARSSLSPPARRRHDWKPSKDSHDDSLPHSGSRRPGIQRSDRSTSTPEDKSLLMPLRRSRTTSSSSPRRKSSKHPGSSSSSAAMPLMSRAATGIPYRRGRFPIEYEEDSRSDSRRSSRRDWSPARYDRRSATTPESLSSSRTSVTRSDDEDEDEDNYEDEAGSAASASTREEKVHRYREQAEEDARRHRRYHREYEEEEKRRARSPAEERRRRRHRHRDVRRETPIVEEEEDVDPAVEERALAKVKAKERDDEDENDVQEDEKEEEGEEEDKNDERPADESKSSARRPALRPSDDNLARKERRRPRASSSASASKPSSSSNSRSNPGTKRYHRSDLITVERAGAVRKSSNTGGSQATSTVSSSTKRHSILGSIFGSSTHTTGPERAPPKLVECVVCLSDLPSTKAPKLKCGHRMCHSCLKRNFKLSIKDPQLMPPKCCTSDHIPLKHVDRLFDNNFKRIWNRKFAEFSTRNRIYCPTKGCGDWIKPENIQRMEDGRRLGRCARCKTKVCGACNGRWHGYKSCPRDEETNKLLQQAKKEGWQRCYKCRAMVELKEGCNHMTCRCGAEFCMICGIKWKGCECPWFNYDAVEADRVAHMQEPFPIRREEAPPSPHEFRGGAARPRPRNYDEEIYMRRMQEEQDEAMARRLQIFGEDDDDDYDIGVEDVGPGSQSGHYVNEDYHRRPNRTSRHSHAAPPPAPPPPGSIPVPFQRPHGVGGDYVVGVNRERGVRESSIDPEIVDRDRLADRFSERRAASSHGSPVFPPPPMMPSPRHSHPSPSMLRMHTPEGELYNSARSTRASERVVPGRLRHDYAEEAALHSPSIRRPHHQHHSYPPAPSQYPASEGGESPKQSTLAGLTGPGRGMNRVFEWRNHVEPGMPEDDNTRLGAQKSPVAPLTPHTMEPPLSMRRPRGIYA